MSRAARAAGWALSAFFCLFLYWLGLRTWFLQDDFAWLNLSLQVDNAGDLLAALFTPRAQGTVRPLSERAFFLGFYWLFGLNALPFRIAVFATQLANLALIGAIARRLTGSFAAGVIAPVLWIANSALAVAMSWTSTYNQVLCAFFLLLSFHLFLRHIETGRRSYWIWQWATFVAGFGALEINAAYPALAAAYAFCCARRHFRKTLWLFVPSIAFAALHWRYAPKPSSGVYEMHFDASIAGTLWRFWEMALGPSRLARAGVELPVWLVAAGTALLTLLIAGFAAWRVRRGEWLAAFLLLWFLIFLAPVLPLRDHASDYYLTTPLVGLAILCAWGLARAWESRMAWRVTALVAAAAYLASSVPPALAITRWNFDRSRKVRSMMAGLTRAAQLHPGKIILLANVRSEVFWAGLKDKPYRLAGLTDVFLAPGSETSIEAHPEFGHVEDFVMPPAVALRALEENRLVIYSAAGPRLRNVTASYGAIAESQWPGAEEPRRVDAGNPMFAQQLGPEWYQLEGRYRWMPRRATVRLGGPLSRSQRLYLAGFCPPDRFASGPTRIQVSVNGRALPLATLPRRSPQFEFTFPLPLDLVGAPRIDVAVEVDRIIRHPGDSRDLGLVFGVIAIR